MSTAPMPNAPLSPAPQTQKVAIFVDVQNVYYTARKIFNRNFDYNTFWRKATEGRQVTTAIAYAVDRGDQKQREFQNILRAIGFEVKLKPFIQRADGSAKGDWDVGITIDALEESASADVVILVSGDGDFDLLVQKLREGRSKKVEVYGVAALTANTLINAASEFIPIENSLLLG
ncbi:NYN domain-containing protein [uncultured Microbulbifer sp.]|uniref:LabA-like NYN domain-containing protein n=1 Tax=uncultured Microbulbifer sp. TaxID=348147 RepID=UPI002610EF3B|nr:NYN domain-containing protein [uncultured Microbulbifer sp.]